MKFKEWGVAFQVILLGTSLGLFAMVLNNTPEDRPMVKLEGLPTIHSMEILPEHQMLFAIAGNFSKSWIITIITITIRYCC